MKNKKIEKLELPDDIKRSLKNLRNRKKRIRQDILVLRDKIKEFRTKNKGSED